MDQFLTGGRHWALVSPVALIRHLSQTSCPAVLCPLKATGVATQLYVAASIGTHTSELCLLLWSIFRIVLSFLFKMSTYLKKYHFFLSFFLSVLDIPRVKFE